MNINDILQQFADTAEQSFFPEAAIQEAKAQWPQFWPAIDALMDQFIAGNGLREAQSQQLFFGLMLMADLPFYPAADKFFQLCDVDDDDDSDLDLLLGDALTEYLPTFFYVMAKGASQPLIQLLHSDKAGLYVKTGAMQALFAQLGMLQSTADAETAQPLQAIIADAIPLMIQQMEKQKQYFALGRLAYFCIAFGLDQFKTQFQQLLMQNKLDLFGSTSREVSRWELSTIRKPLASEQVTTSFDLMVLKKWAGFQTPEELEQRRLRLREATAAMFPPAKLVTKALVGRNDPCPCGSGKKYKKCCLQ
ncbi:DUF1186 domain-containing protein [Rheinheimera riviphila]|uniref:DUF1186 domain-containing protein n=1 Tax=Rheinheimera riviphila TaxID=1834037 RepID=A0A437QII8_9GAMM|nr:DUF1186 domain-containing protein [Rheinheimera riviphila]RVU34341.1 DUF1186 domain-containing protein [Rheinheimera riviphila]